MLRSTTLLKYYKRNCKVVCRNVSELKDQVLLFPHCHLILQNQRTHAMQHFNRVSVDDLLNKPSSMKEGKKSIRPTDVFKFVCSMDNCNRAFASEATLKSHQVRTHGPPTSFVCPRCGSSYSSVPNLNKHVSLLIPILQLDDRFPQSIVSYLQLLVHNTIEMAQIKTVHEKLKPFRCQICESSFPYRDGLTRHIQMVHEKRRPFSCSFCSMKFKTRAHLNKHSLALHPERHMTAPKASGSSS